MENNYFNGYDTAAAEKATNVMMKKVYLWMCGALAITGITSFYVASNPGLMSILFSNSWSWIVLLLVELGLVISLTGRIHRLSSVTATLLFLAYSVINGLTLSTIFVVYEIGSIANAFFVSAGTFGVMALYGTITNKDLTKLGSLCFMALFGLIIALVVSVFVNSSMLELIISIVGVLLFVGLTAYDAQKIKDAFYGVAESEEASKYAVIGALDLYLDFVNLFLYILRFMNRRN